MSTVYNLPRCILRDSINASKKEGHVASKIFLYNSWPRCASPSQNTLFSPSKLRVLFNGISRKRFLIIFVSLTNLSPTILPLMISYPVTTHLTNGLFTATPWRTANMSLASEISQQYDSGSGTHYCSTIFLAISRNLVSLHFCWGSTPTFVASQSTFIRDFPFKSVVTRAPLFSHLVTDNVDSYINMLSFSGLFSSSIGSRVQYIGRSPISVNF